MATLPTGTWLNVLMQIGFSCDSGSYVNLFTRNTTPAKPREGRCSKSGPKSNTHCVSYIVRELTADHILTSSKMAASSVLTNLYTISFHIFIAKVNVFLQKGSS